MIEVIHVRLPLSVTNSKLSVLLSFKYVPTKSTTITVSVEGGGNRHISVVHQTFNSSFFCILFLVLSRIKRPHTTKLKSNCTQKAILLWPSLQNINTKLVQISLLKIWIYVWCMCKGPSMCGICWISLLN